MNTTIEHKVVYVDQSTFAKEVELYGNKVQAIHNIKKEVRKYLPHYTVKESFFSDILNNFYNALLKKYKKENTLNLKGEKLALLLDIDVSELNRLANIYYKLKDITSPSIETHTVYTETDEELKRFEECEKLINCINEIEENTGVKAYPFDVLKAFRRILDFNVRTNQYTPNYRWIKGLRH